MRAQPDEGTYPKGVKITDAQLAALPLAKHDFHPTGTTRADRNNNVVTLQS